MIEKNDNKGLAIASLVLSLVGLLVFGLPFGILAVIFGALSYEHGMAKAGIIIGIFDIVAVLFFLSLL